MKTDKCIKQATVLLVYVLVAVNGNTWGYTDKVWKPNYQTCDPAGLKQSPINLDSNLAIKEETTPLVFSPLTNVAGMLAQPHQAIKFTLTGTTEYTVKGGPLSATYKLAQMHMHAKSEHKLDGAQSDVEIHFVHYNKKFSDLTAAVTSNEYNAVAVISVFADEPTTGKENKALKPISEALPPAPNGTTLTLSPYGFLPSDLTTFFHYNGSLTTPGCNEVVQWVVLKNKVEFYTIASPSELSKLLNDNFREVIPRTLVYKDATSDSRVLFLTATASSSTGGVDDTKTVPNSGVSISCAALILVLEHIVFHEFMNY